MSVQTAFRTEKRSVLTLGALSILLTLVLASLPLLVVPLFVA